MPRKSTIQLFVADIAEMGKTSRPHGTAGTMMHRIMLMRISLAIENLISLPACVCVTA